MSDPRLPDIHIIQIEGDVASVVTSPICDFCGDIGPSWDYGCEDFVLENLPSPFQEGAAWASMGEWCVCGECAALIEQRLGADLAVRMLHAIDASVPRQKAFDYVGEIIQGFFDHMTGERTPFG